MVCSLDSVKKKIYIYIGQQQLEQKVAPRVLSSIKKVEHVTSVLKSLHWPPILLLTYKALNGLRPEYIFVLLVCHKASNRSGHLGHVYSMFPGSKSSKVEQLVISVLATCGISFLNSSAKTVRSCESGLETQLLTVAFQSARYLTLSNPATYLLSCFFNCHLTFLMHF